MGELTIESYADPDRLRRFMKSLLNDVRALNLLLESGRIEEGRRRIGAEQELCLVDRAWRPAPYAEEVLSELPPGSAFTPEIGKFNVEFNLQPCTFGSDCLHKLENALNEHLDQVRKAAAKHGLEVLMTGILPTLKKSDVGVHNMMDRPRYHALNEALMRLRGGEFDLRLTGTDELIIKHDSVMLESCNTSFQVHFQVAPSEFARLYNIAQVATAPSLAAAVNSPLLFGRRLWRETRIALFQQAVDTRPTGNHVLDRSARVSFGESWVRESVLEIYHEDITRFRVVLGVDVDEDSAGIVAQGGIPKLKALTLHNGTVYRWNRPCYGVLDGVPTLRIENRALPAGPSVIDEVANAAFWFGLVSGMLEEFGDITRVLSFDTAKSNFLAAGRQGLDAQLEWIGGRSLPARQLVRRQLLPLAREGLVEAGVEESDIDRYLKVIEGRVTTGRTGAMWHLESLAGMDRSAKPVEKMSALVAGTIARQKKGLPVHKWKPARLDEAGDWRHSYHRVEQYMTTELFTVHENEVIDLVAHVMDWKHVRHVPVEDDDGKLVGLVSYRSLLRLLAHDILRTRATPVAVQEVMNRDIVTIPPETTTLEAIELMRREKVACLPVVTDGRLVGIVSERDFLRVAGNLLLSRLREES
jgi:CBS domain-containing protein/gamma-glutamylcysteine synthetase